MFSKKLTAILVAVGVVASTCAIFSQINIKAAFAETIKQNVVYTKDDTSAVSQNNTELSDADNEALKEKSSEALKKYFNTSTDTDKNFDYYASVTNATNLIEDESKEQKTLQNEYDNKQISAEEYNNQKAEIPKHYKALKNTVEKLKHGFIQTAWINGNDGYLVFFNENTKEIEYAIGNMANSHKESDTPLTLSEEQLKNIAENFIKEHKLGDLKNPKCILIQGTRVFYQEENDPSKKVKIKIDGYTGKVGSFAIKSYADMFYDEAINEK